MREQDILYEKSGYYITRAPIRGFEVWRHEVTCAVRCAQIGYTGQRGLERAKHEIEKRLLLRGA